MTMGVRTKRGPISTRETSGRLLSQRRDGQTDRVAKRSDLGLSENSVRKVDALDTRIENDNGCQNETGANLDQRNLGQAVVFALRYGLDIIYENKEYVSPNQVRSDIRRGKAGRYSQRRDGQTGQSRPEKPRAGCCLCPSVRA
jgi:hypothetical protein